MPLKNGYSRDTIAENIGTLIRDGKSRTQAIAIALEHARESFFKRHPDGALPRNLAYPDGRRMKPRGKNPVPPSSKVQIRDASVLYEDFTGEDADIHELVDKPEIPDVLLCVGEIDFIGYTTRRDGVIERYKHDFASKSRPLFCVTPDGKQIVLLGGAYDFTERGIIDRNV